MYFRDSHKIHQVDPCINDVEAGLESRPPLDHYFRHALTHGCCKVGKVVMKKMALVVRVNLEVAPLDKAVTML